MSPELIKHFRHISCFYKKNLAGSFNKKTARAKYLSHIDLQEKWKFSKEQEFRFFSALHFLKYKIHKCFINNREKEVTKWISIYIKIRNKISTENIGLPYKMAMNKYFSGHKHNMDEMISTGLSCLFRCIDFFDPWANFKFSTYASNSIFRQIYRDIIDKRKHYVTQSELGDNISFDELDSTKNNEHDIPEDDAEKIKHIIKNNTANLNEREQEVVNRMFGFYNNSKCETLKQIGKYFNLTKESIRLTKESALQKIKNSLLLAS